MSVSQKGLAWMQQQEQWDVTELMKIRDRVALQKITDLRQMKLPFESL